jgi:hypothetical protein
VEYQVTKSMGQEAFLEASSTLRYYEIPILLKYQIFIIVFTRRNHGILSRARLNQSTFSYPILEAILMLTGDRVAQSV